MSNAATLLSAVLRIFLQHVPSVRGWFSGKRDQDLLQTYAYLHLIIARGVRPNALVIGLFPRYLVETKLGFYSVSRRLTQVLMLVHLNKELLSRSTFKKLFGMRCSLFVNIAVRITFIPFHYNPLTIRYKIATQSRLIVCIILSLNNALPPASDEIHPNLPNRHTHSLSEAISKLVKEPAAVSSARGGVREPFIYI